jgi:hypothetical protein
MDAIEKAMRENNFDVGTFTYEVALPLHSFPIPQQHKLMITYHYYNYICTLAAEVGIPGLLHFVYKSLGTSQITCPKLGPPYTDRHEKKR